MAIRARLTAPRETREDWPWHEVESTSLSASLLFSGDRRMEAENFLAPGFAIRHSITSKASGWKTLSDVARTWQPSRLKGIQVSPEYGTPVLAATQVFDVRPVPRKWLSLDRTYDHAQRFVDSGTILLTCSGSVGRATLSDKSIANVLISHDLLRIDVVERRLRGWVYAYLRSPTIRAMMTSAQYGHMIKHLEVGHLDALPFISVPDELAVTFNSLTDEVVSARDRAYDLVQEAEELFSREIGAIKDSSDGSLGFATSTEAIFGNGRRLEGHYHNPLARSAEQAIGRSGHRLERLSDLVDRVFIPGRFKHVYGEGGLPYLDSAQILEVSPDINKRVLSLEGEKSAGYLVDAGTLLLPCSGQLHGIIGSVVLAGEWHENKVLTNHILRIVPKERPTVRIGYLQAVLAHPKLGKPRVQRGAFGSSVPELSVFDIENMTIPRLGSIAEDAIADSMEEAGALMAQANSLEDEIAERAETIVERFLK